MERETIFFEFEEAWKELETLLLKAEQKGLPNLSDRELRRFCLLYRTAATQLSRMRSFTGSVLKVDYLNGLVVRAHTFLYAPKGKSGLWRTILLTPLVIPEVIRTTIGYHAAAFLLLIAGGLYGFFGAQASTEWTLNFVQPGERRTVFAEREELYETLRMGREEGKEVSLSSKTGFAAFLWQNNTQVGLFAFFGGILAAAPTLILILFNGTLLGVYSAVFHIHDLAYEWWAWILPHGITELLGVILMGGGGLLLGKTVLVSQGGLSRREAFKKIRGKLVYIVLLAFPLFFIAAVIESYLRQSQLSDFSRYYFAAASAVFWVIYLCLVRVPDSLRKKILSRTKAEEVISLPSEEELFEALGMQRNLRGGFFTKAPLGGSQGRH